MRIRKGIFRNGQIRIRLLQSLLRKGRLVAVPPVRGQLIKKMNITFFYHKSDAEYFFIHQYFRNYSTFRENSEKLFFRHIQPFLGKGGVLHLELTKPNILLFNRFFKKSCKAEKPFLGAKSILKGREHLATKMNTTFLWKM